MASLPSTCHLYFSVWYCQQTLWGYTKECEKSKYYVNIVLSTTFWIVIEFHPNDAEKTAKSVKPVAQNHSHENGNQLLILLNHDSLEKLGDLDTLEEVQKGCE